MPPFTAKIYPTRFATLGRKHGPLLIRETRPLGRAFWPPPFYSPPGSRKSLAAAQQDQCGPLGIRDHQLDALEAAFDQPFRNPDQMVCWPLGTCASALRIQMHSAPFPGRAENAGDGEAQAVIIELVALVLNIR
jgi:hypothetical protein